MSSPWFSRILAAVLLAGTTLWIVMGGAPERVPETERQSQDTVLVETQISTQKPYRQIFTVPATVRPLAQDTLFMATGGTITQVYVTRGQQVKAGETLIQQDVTLETIKLEQAKTSQETAQETLNRTESLFTSGTASQAALETAQETFAIAQSALKDAQNNLENRTLKAPYDGVILDILVEENTRLTPGTETIIIAKTESLFLDVYLSERETSLLDTNEPAKAGNVTAMLDYLSPQATNTRTILARFKTNDTSLRLNTPIDLTLTGKEQMATEVPLNSILIDSAGNPAVFVIENNVAKMKPVTVLASASTTWVEGLNTNSAIVIKGQNSLRDGQDVRVSP